MYVRHISPENFVPLSLLNESIFNKELEHLDMECEGN
jgi:hypothetical protein